MSTFFLSDCMQQDLYFTIMVFACIRNRQLKKMRHNYCVLVFASVHRLEERCAVLFYLFLFWRGGGGGGGGGGGQGHCKECAAYCPKIMEK